MTDVETKVSTVFVRLSGPSERIAHSADGDTDDGLMDVLSYFQMETRLKFTIKRRLRNARTRGHLRSNYDLSGQGHVSVEIRAFSDFEKIPIFISEFDFYIFTKVGFQSDSRSLIG